MSSMSSIRLNVVISSIFNEFVEYRGVVIDAIWRCDMYPLAMERLDFAMPISKIESSLNMIDNAALYVGIFSQRYGEITFKEYERAVERGIPVLAFISDDTLNEGDVELDHEKQVSMAELKSTLRRKYVVATFSSLEEFQKKAFASLINWKIVYLQEYPLEIIPENKRRLITSEIPRPNVPYYHHQYSLGFR